MVKIPKYVQDAIKKSANYHAEARRQQGIFEKWIQEKYGLEILENDSIRDTIIDCVEQSYNPNEAIEMIVNIIERLTDGEESEEM